MQPKSCKVMHFDKVSACEYYTKQVFIVLTDTCVP
jgi:hypothetical protein